MIRLFRVFVPTSVLVLIVSECLLIFFSYIAASYVVFTQVDPEVFLLYDGGLNRIGLVALIIMLGLYLNDLYADVRVRARILLAQQLSLSMGVAFIAQALLGYGQQNLILPKWLMIYGSGIALTVIGAASALKNTPSINGVRTGDIHAMPARMITIAAISTGQRHNAGPGDVFSIRSPPLVTILGQSAAKTAKLRRASQRTHAMTPAPNSTTPDVH